MNLDILKQFEAELDGQAQAPVSRRDALRRTGKIGLSAAALAVPFFGVAEQAMARKFSGAARYHGVLNYALTLEYLEYHFYQMAVDTADIPSQDRALFTSIRDHELAHVNLLKGAVEATGNPAVFYEAGDFDFTAAGFDPFASGNYPLFLALAQGFEDTGVRAYKGKATALKNDSAPDALDILTVALQIHSVEARHAAAVRRLRDKTAYITGDATDVAQIEAVYAGEDNVTQGGVNLTSALSGYSTANITESFDEPLTEEAVLAIAGPFITGDGMP